MSENGHMLPHSISAERGLLGGVLIDSDVFYEVDTLVKAADFYLGAHREIYKAISGLFQEKMAADLITVAEVLKQRGITQVKDTPVDAYLIGLTAETPTSINAPDHARIVEATSIRRRLHHAANKIATLAQENDKSVNKVLGEAEKALFEVTDTIATKGIVSAKEGMSKLYDLIQERVATGGETVGIETGFIDLDRVLRGLKPGKLYVLAGRPGMGKSMLESIIAYNAAANGHGVARFNLEMDVESLYMRLVSYTAKTDFTQIEEGRLNPAEHTRVNTAIGKLETLPMFVDSNSSLTMTQLAAKARRLHIEHGIKLVTVDYMQLMSVDKSYGSRTQDVGQLSRGLKHLALELHIPILALAQLSRACEQRSDKRPQLSDLRDSGEIEQDADAVLFMYRDEYYKKETTERPNIVEVNVAKHRNGPTGVADMYFNGRLMRIANLKADKVEF